MPAATIASAPRGNPLTLNKTPSRHVTRASNFIVSTTFNLLKTVSIDLVELTGSRTVCTTAAAPLSPLIPRTKIRFQPFATPRLFLSSC